MFHVFVYLFCSNILLVFQVKMLFHLLIVVEIDGFGNGMEYFRFGNDNADRSITKCLRCLSDTINSQ